MSLTREKFLKAAAVLIEKKGYGATGLSEIIKLSRAPKGSLYYHFPHGKEQLAAEVVTQAGAIVAGRIQDHAAHQPDPETAIRTFLYRVAERMEETNFHTGSTITLVALESATQSKRINLACRDSYSMLIGAFAKLIEGAGLAEARARDVATMLVAAVEGAIVLSRTFHSADPLRRVADHIHDMLQASQAA
jgi:TetR/AcrR family transcriptional repressor of lmrAB and yxaGH operons